MPVWCGGMLESGVGRAHNIAITTLANFTLPGDTAASSKYWPRDIIHPEITVDNGIISVPDTPGIGYEPDHDQIKALTYTKKSILANLEQAGTKVCQLKENPNDEWFGFFY